MLEHGSLAPQASLEDVYEDLRSGNPFRASVWIEDEEILDWLSLAVASARNVTLAIDEYSFWYSSPTHLPNKGILAIVRCGRKLKQRFLVTTQSPGAINKQMLSQAKLWILPLAEPREADYVLARTSGQIDPRELRAIETTPDGRTLVAHVVSYVDGVREDYALDCRVPSLTLLKDAPKRSTPEESEESDEIPLDIPPKEDQNPPE